MFTDCDSIQTESPSRGAKSRQQLKPNATTEKAKVATKKAVKKPQGCEVELSILQTAFNEFLEAGGQATICSGGDSIRLEIMGAMLCGNCEVWTTEQKCPVCG